MGETKTGEEFLDVLDRIVEVKRQHRPFILAAAETPEIEDVMRRLTEMLRPHVEGLYSTIKAKETFERCKQAVYGVLVHPSKPEFVQITKQVVDQAFADPHISDQLRELRSGWYDLKYSDGVTEDDICEFIGDVLKLLPDAESDISCAAAPGSPSRRRGLFIQSQEEKIAAMRKTIDDLRGELAGEEEINRVKLNEINELSERVERLREKRKLLEEHSGSRITQRSISEARVNDTVAQIRARQAELRKRNEELQKLRQKLAKEVEAGRDAVDEVERLSKGGTYQPVRHTRRMAPELREEQNRLAREAIAIRKICESRFDVAERLSPELGEVTD